MKSNIYISRKVLNQQDIVDWARESGFETMMPEDSLHVTVVYCSRLVDWSLVERDQPEIIFVPAEEEGDVEERAVHNFNGGACVLELNIPELTERNEALRGLGIHSSFPDYRAHITITYNKPKSMKVKNVKPYRGAIILGPEVIAPATGDWKEEYKEISLTEPEVVVEAVNLDIDRLYDIFSDAYNRTTGTAWTKEKFVKRAANWTFYGNDEGFVAFREQASGMRKLVGVAGETSGVIMGLKQLQEEGKPVWGAVGDKLARAAKRYGLIAPHLYIGGPLALKLLVNMIPSSVFGGVKPSVGGDGALTLQYDDVGETKKFFIANREYFTSLLSDPEFEQRLSAPIKKFIKKLI